MGNKELMDQIKKMMGELENSLENENKAENKAENEVENEVKNEVNNEVKKDESSSTDESVVAGAEAVIVESENTEENAGSDETFYQNCEKEEESRNECQKQDKKVCGGLKTALIAFVAAFCAFAIILGALTIVPTPEKSVLAKFIKKYSKTTTIYMDKEDDSAKVDGTEISEGSDVVINVNTTSIATAVYAKCKDSVVGIRLVQTSGYFWNTETETVCEGSGVIYTEDGYIITNHHIVEDALDSNGKLGSSYEVEVFLDTDLQEYFVATLVGYDETTDLALLKIEKTGLTPIEFADSDEIEIGSNAVAIGSPGGLEYMNSVTTGIISGVNRVISDSSTTQYDLIQTDTTINPGNSGGALLNEEGKLIGINAIKIVASGYENMGFAISSNTVKKVIAEIKESGTIERAMLGITIYTAYNKTIAEKYDFPLGCYVNSVNSGSCCEKAGMLKDDIITEIDGTAISDFVSLKKILNDHKPNDTVTIKVYRTTTKEYVELTVVLDKATD